MPNHPGGYWKRGSMGVQACMYNCIDFPAGELREGKHKPQSTAKDRTRICRRT